ncbi:hypothetical protein MUGA111182_00805 [Mucilaginibacter galii]
MEIFANKGDYKMVIHNFFLNKPDGVLLPEWRQT